MKVLMFGWEFPPFNSGGLGTACQGLTKGLSKNGVEITFVLPRKMAVSADHMKIIFGDVKVHYINSILSAYMDSRVYEQKLSVQESPAFYGRSLFEEVDRYAAVAGRIARTEDFDVIHAHDWLTFKAGVEAKKASGKPLVVHVHSTEFDRTGGNGNNQRVYDIERYGMQNADAIIAVSNYTKKKIVEHYGVPPDKVSVVHNGVEFENWTLERAYELKKNKKIVLFLGRLTLQKGPDYFVYAAKRVLDTYPDALFLIVGTGDMEHKLINKVAELGIADRVLFAGFVSPGDLRKSYKMADLYVMPSVSEPFGIAALEALTHGTPIIISKQSGVSEVLSHCLKVDFWDVDEMSNKIIAVLKYGVLGDCLRENGSREVSRFSWENPARQCIAVYNSVLGRRS